MVTRFGDPRLQVSPLGVEAFPGILWFSVSTVSTEEQSSTPLWIL
ncbi:hypothetical protein TSC_c04710 [Thermus scotoductus SA-01]|uniref:Uncharacterized protein n=1 Tax=Thermus scotoductus (strain ATCC 700910 / SA-01) TaxID=743525 RepID=E8PLL8_THESS|nr:hypothetical protein TSC_c04710 [Thermus scotoductus SA-01]